MKPLLGGTDRMGFLGGSRDSISRLAQSPYDAASYLHRFMGLPHAVTISLGLAAASLATGLLGWNLLEREGCDSYPLSDAPSGPIAGPQGTIRFRIENINQAQDVTICVFDSKNVKRFQKEASLPARGELSFEMHANTSEYVRAFEVDRGGFFLTRAVLVSFVEPLNCTSGKSEYRVQTDFDRGSSGIIGGSLTCAGTNDANQSRFTSPAPVGSTSQGRPPEEGPGVLRNAQLAISTSSLLASASGTLVAVAYRHALGLLGFGLFTRLVRPKLLEHEGRSQIVAAVANDPGIHARALARLLDQPRSAMEYHLAVLVREGLLAAYTSRGFPTLLRPRPA